jgi:hypothetical protein
MKMAITAGKFPLAALAVGITLILAGCGLTQKVTDGTVAVTKSIFYKQIKTLHLDIRAREAVNSNAGGVALSTVVRIYQLKDRKTFDRRTTRHCLKRTVRSSKQTCWRRKISSCSRAGRSRSICQWRKCAVRGGGRDVYVTGPGEQYLACGNEPR